MLPPAFPCLGDSYSIQQNNDNTAKIVLPRTDKNCPFVQLPPSINQPARVNADFVTQDSPPQWRILNEWENSIRGWLVINQANITLQVFTPDGTFLREYGVARGGDIFTRPFAANDELAASLDPIMRGLMINFADPDYIADFFRTMTTASETIQANPSSYSESMLSVLGKPVAVTAFGVSLGLADPPMTNLSTNAPTNTSVTPADLLSYAFGLKVEDKDNVFNGTFSLFTAAKTITDSAVTLINWKSF